MQTQLLSGSYSCCGEAALKCKRPPTDSEMEAFSAKKWVPPHRQGARGMAAGQQGKGWWGRGCRGPSLCLRIAQET